MITPADMTPTEHATVLLAAHAQGEIPAAGLAKLREHLAHLARDLRVPEALRLRAAVVALDLDRVIEAPTHVGPALLARRPEDFCGCRLVLELVEPTEGGPDLRIQVPEGYSVDRVVTALNRARGVIVFEGGLRRE